MFRFEILMMLVWLLMSSTVYSQIQKGQRLDGRWPNSQFGSSVAISDDGSIIAIGGTESTYWGNPGPGYVQAYFWDEDQWTAMGSPIEGKTLSDKLGSAVALSSDGRTLAVINPYHRDPDCSYPFSSCLIFRWEGSDWIQLGDEIMCIGGMINGEVGLSDDGNILVIGVPGSIGDPRRPGYVKAFAWNGSNWEPMGEPIGPATHKAMFGNALSLSSDGMTVVVGGAGQFGPDNGFESFVTVYQFNSGEWKMKGDTLKDSETGSRFGSSASISADGNTIAIGSPYKFFDRSNTGQCDVYSWDGMKWQPMGNSILGRNDLNFGYSLDLSSDGLSLAVGILHAGFLGRARVFKFNGAEWGQVGSTILGEESRDYFGYRLALSGSGEDLIVGAVLSAANGQEAGHARVFSLKGITSFAADVPFEKVSLWPNPVHDRLSIESKKPFERYCLFDASGMLVAKGILEFSNNENSQISLSEVQPGLYFLHLYCSQESIIQKLIKF